MLTIWVLGGCLFVGDFDIYLASDYSNRWSIHAQKVDLWKANLWQQTWNATMGHLCTIIMQEYCSSHSKAVTCHFMHACELNLSLILCVNGQVKGESGNCKKYVRHCNRLLGATKKTSNCPPTSQYWEYYSMLVANKTHMYLSELLKLTRSLFI